MNFHATYNSPIGEITIITNEACVLFLGFTGQRYFENAMTKLSPFVDFELPKTNDCSLVNCDSLQKSIIAENEQYCVETPTTIAETFRWLDIYFSGIEPNFIPTISLIGTDFQKLIWDLLLKIPYGKTMTYEEIANEVAKIRGIEKMSNRAVGNAVGKNPISLIIPCHRVIGKNGNLTGYAGGLERKEYLLKLESTD